MLRVLNTPRARIKAAASSIKQDQKLHAMMIYYPSMERLLICFASVITEIPRLAGLIKSGLDTVESHKRLVAIADDSIRIQDFFQRFIEAASLSSLYATQSDTDGLKFSLTPPAFTDATQSAGRRITEAEIMTGKWFQIVRETQDPQIDQGDHCHGCK